MLRNTEVGAGWLGNGRGRGIFCALVVQAGEGEGDEGNEDGVSSRKYWYLEISGRFERICPRKGRWLACALSCQTSRWWKRSCWQIYEKIRRFWIVFPLMVLQANESWLLDSHSVSTTLDWLISPPAVIHEYTDENATIRLGIK